MSDLRKAAEELIKEWDWECGEHQNKALTDLIEALRQALAQPEQRGHCTCGDPEALGVVHFRTRPCFHYIHQPKREWIGLTDEDKDELLNLDNWTDIVEAVEAKLKEKNGG